LADWFVYQHDAAPLGPWSTQEVGTAILSGRLPAEAWVAAPGAAHWVRALEVPVIAEVVTGVATRPRRESGLRVMPGVVPTGEQPQFGGTMMMVKDDEVELVSDRAPAPVTSPAPTTERGPIGGGAATGTTPTPLPTTPSTLHDAASESAPETDRALPPSSSDLTPKRHAHGA